MWIKVLTLVIFSSVFADVLYLQGWERVLHVLHCTDSIFKMYYIKRVYYMVLTVNSMCTRCTTFWRIFLPISCLFSRPFLVYFQGLFLCNYWFFCASRYILLVILKRKLMSFDCYCHVFKLDEAIKKHCTLVIHLKTI